jgi:carotenoid cleavage dioxygenase-like enzyme
MTEKPLWGFATPDSVSTQPVPLHFRERVQPETTIFWIVKRSQLTDDASEVVASRVEVPGHFQHFFANFEDRGDEITLFGLDPRNDPSIVVKEKGPLQGLITSAYDLGSIERIVLRPTSSKNGAAFDKVEDMSASFVSSKHTFHNALYTFEGNHPRGVHKEAFFINLGYRPELMTADVRRLYGETRQSRRIPFKELPDNSRRGTPCTLFNLDLTTMKVSDEFTFPDGVIVLSPLVLRPPSSSRRYMIVVVNKDPVDEIWLFDADKLSEGPIAKLGHADLKLGFTLHTLYLAQLGNYSVKYKINATDEFMDALDKTKFESGDKERLKAAIEPQLRKSF